jgi:hypothetical protein
MIAVSIANAQKVAVNISIELFNKGNKISTD